MSSHTPGPFHLETVHNEVKVCAKEGDRTVVLAYIIPLREWEWDNNQQEYAKVAETAKYMANAKLFAAAPELREYLVELFHIIQDGEEMDNELEQEIEMLLLRTS